jgi:hypothetical protein
MVEPKLHRIANGKYEPQWHIDTMRFPLAERSKLRSKTYSGIARAMAGQWADKEILEAIINKQDTDDNYKRLAILETIEQIKKQGIKFRRLDFQDSENFVCATKNKIMVVIFYGYGGKRGIKLQERRSNFINTILFNDKICFCYDIKSLS